MIIKKIYIGNEKHAFIDDRFSPKVNIISSNDNNKGKTIVIQSIMYCFGNVPAFPTSFDYKNYYYILELDHNQNTYLICRKGNNFIIKHKNQCSIFDNTSEFKRYWNKNIENLPSIPKDNTTRIVDPELFLQLFFVGQDKKITYDIANKGFYKKDDFFNLLCSIKGFLQEPINQNDIDKINDEINKLKNKRNILLKENKILKKNNIAVEYLSNTNDRISLQNKLKDLESIKNKLLELRKERNHAISRKSKNELVLKELRSLNRTINVGKVICLDCGSNHISYESSDSEFSFDLSTAEMRSQILNSIQEKIDVYQEEIDRLTIDIHIYQKKFNDYIKDENISLDAILIMSKELENNLDPDKEITEIDTRLAKLKENISSKRSILIDNKDKQKNLFNQIVEQMNKVYKYINLKNNTVYDAIFSSKDKIYSGSEATEFHIARILSFQKILNHNYPIIIDSFRAEDLSSEREDKVIKLFKKLNNQVILTTTLKKEEIGKYDLRTDIHHIDYSNHKTFEILSPDYLDEFLSIAKTLMIKL
ncbi:hypothetical protein [Clostridium perfringens]|uniref:hypothetical protein n=1 Tax=Clostridium perfringens TaxID=1502 RepID=UPI001CACB102|nr:hypothetical protein CPBEC5_00560 [Clostridium perfringens]STB10675.1 cytoplasmic protein [Clostridium novyi]HCG3019776.1 hypothetical protein [Clostridium perfringens]